MTDNQARVLAKVRQRGVMLVGELTTYEGRSLEPLRLMGYVEFVSCGECMSCKGNGWCRDLKVRKVR